ncbi:MAG TPA: flagellar biosynthesis anti-sigma factor FlgM [Acidobacteriaceae bacterium]|jgi:negative regulator of flagellin synthesis FlgM
MKIPGDLQPIQQTQEASPPSSVVGKTAAVPLSPAGQAGDQAHLSTAANIVSQSVSQSDVRTDKVASVQAAIAGGSYHVESSQIAGKLIDHMLGGGQ